MCRVGTKVSQKIAGKEIARRLLYFKHSRVHISPTSACTHFNVSEIRMHCTVEPILELYCRLIAFFFFPTGASHIQLYLGA